MQEAKGSHYGADDGHPSSVSHYSLSTMLQSHWRRLFWTVKHEKRESRGEEMECHINLFEFYGRASGTGYFSRVTLLHQCSKKIHESTRPTQVYLLGQWDKLCRAKREIREAIEDWNQKQVLDELLQKGCQWAFQPPKASHASGVWERLIRRTRTAIKAILGESLVNEEVLTTMLTEVESILNSRPLCAASDDPNDCEPLTSNHLLLQKAVHVLPPGVFVREDKFARRIWRQAQVLADHFWKQWLREYVSGLQERQKWQRPCRNAEIGDLALLVDDCLPRGQWHMGRVIKTLPGRVRLVRTVVVKTGTSTT